jgi:hypothetical protein
VLPTEKLNPVFGSAVSVSADQMSRNERPIAKRLFDALLTGPSGTAFGSLR